MHSAVVVRGVPPDRAWAWWTDFREGGEDHAFARWAHPERRLERREDGTLVLTESAKVLWLRYREVDELTLAKPRIHFEARNNFGRFRGTLRFLAEAGGTRIEVAWDMEPVRWLRWLGPLGRFGVVWFFAWDLRHHARDLEREGGASVAGT